MNIIQAKIRPPKKWREPSKVEPLSSYLSSWPSEYSNVPAVVIETWIYRHWSEFQEWLPLNPLEWQYEPVTLSNDEIMTIRYPAGKYAKTLESWGNDLISGQDRKSTRLGKYMLESGTTPAPIIVAKNAGNWAHPREHGLLMCEPLQIIEGHMRMAYLQGMIRFNHVSLKASHQVIMATLPNRFIKQ
jgi:hypothetical protein